jgi:formylglycine-generating enzyme required for sulfatase activity/energy-coupling factor transporter ATP-binding protein EcfA2
MALPPVVAHKTGDARGRAAFLITEGGMMRRTALLFTLVCIVPLLATATARAQTPAPPPTPTPTLLQQTEKEIPWWLAGVAGLVFGGILVWVLRPVFEKLGNAIAEGLSKLGSGWGFKKRYLTHLIEEYRGLNIRGLKTKAPVTVELEHVYVSLHAQVPDKALGRQAPPALDVSQALNQHERLAILGGPGTGKTTLLSYLTLTYARKQAKKRLGIKEKRLPILVPLRRLKQVLEDGDGAGTLPAYLTEWYTDLGMHPRESFFERALQRGRCVVLLDGLDEVADEAERRQMSEWVDRLVTIYPENRYVVTSRPPGYDSAALENGFTVLRVRDFVADEIRQFADNWCLAVELAAQGEDNATARRRARDAARDLVGAIEANPAIRKLAVNPLLLSIIALVHRYRATLPRQRVDLYAECVDVLLGHWDEAKGLAGKLSPGQKRAVLQPLALAMHRDQRRDIPRRDLEGRIADLLPKVGGEASEAAADAGDFLDEVRERSGLLVEVGLDTYAFSHLTFQEYLAAREAVEDEALRPLLLNKAGDEWWQEVVLLYAGMTDATPLVERLLSVEDDQDCQRLLLAGRCVAEAVRVEKAVREQVVRRLEERFVTCIGEPFLQTGQVLAEVAGEDSVEFFLRLARDDAERREAALWSLGEMGRQPNESLRERVIERLMTHFQGEELQQEAGAALAMVWGIRMLDELRGRQAPPSLRKRGMDALAEAMDLMMLEVPAGEFLMGKEKRTVYVAAFQVDKYPVTNAQYKRFVDATKHSAPRHWEGGMYPDGKAVHPVVHVTWHDAVSYADWADKRLPTEEEWEKAARGTNGREYPWGDWAEGRCNTRESGIGDTTPVGQYSPGGDSPYGCVDMAGNVWEWTSSEYETGSDRRVVRGGSWDLYQFYARCAFRFRFFTVNSFEIYGVSVRLPRPF